MMAAVSTWLRCLGRVSGRSSTGRHRPSSPGSTREGAASTGIGAGQANRFADRITFASRIQRRIQPVVIAADPIIQRASIAQLRSRAAKPRSMAGVWVMTGARPTGPAATGKSARGDPGATAGCGREG